MGDCCGCFLSVSLSSIGLAILLVAVLDWIQRRNKRNESLENQHVVITGGSSGIGKQVGILASQRGANVTILARDSKKLEEACAEVRAAAKDDNQKINYFSVDVTNYDQAEQTRTSKDALKKIGPVDKSLICCAF
ncbi:3-ketodihydrosphingosine reductase [Orchesella cincta]|uniref:3-ketodihydrosphingosine reductase n=1 Tax=Orchesella cincta TaxID=48709 RepID=A0A1D2N8A4_ORCCI|nr:3-ketodihydrosphingosine reductase [Orchesella cincta]